MAKQIERIADDLRNSVAVEPITVRQLLSWYYAQRRGYWVVWRIRKDLERNGLATLPDFEGAWIDGHIAFVIDDETPQERTNDGENESKKLANSSEVGDENQTLWITQDPSHQISKLASANQTVVSIKPNETIARAVTKMIFHDFSQLPVSNGERNLQGVISWKTIGPHLALNGTGTEVKEAMEHANEVRHDASMFDAMRIIAEHDYVIVRDREKKISGIVTATDLNEQFRYLSEPFLLLSEIENLLRNLIGDCFDLDTLKAACEPIDGREISSLSDLSFGEYIRLIEHSERWEKLGLSLDRIYFCESLDFVRKIRNEVMHFDPDGIESDQLRRLRETAGALRRLEAMKNRN